MRNVLLAGGGVLAVLALALGIGVATRPDELTVERSRVVQASPDDLWPYVSNFHAFMKWSPWQDLDPTQVSEFSEPASGVGAWYTWKGNGDVGSGRMEITGMEPNARVEQDLTFIEPFASEADVVLALAPEGAGTRVTWRMTSQNDWMGKAFGLIVDMDAMLGADFEKGLERLGSLAEASRAEREKDERAAAEVEAELKAALDAANQASP